MQDTRHRTDVAELTDRGKMVHASTASHRHIVSDLNVPSQHSAVGDHNTITQTTVVRYVGSDHQKVVVANDRNAILFVGRSIDRTVFTESIAVTDFHTRW